MTKDLRLSVMRAFVAVAETESFTDAGGKLSISKSSVSKLVSEYESILGIRLFNRTTRHVSLTHAGQTLLPSIRAALRFIDARHDQAIDQARPKAPTRHDAPTALQERLGAMSA